MRIKYKGVVKEELPAWLTYGASSEMSRMMTNLKKLKKMEINLWKK